MKQSWNVAGRLVLVITLTVAWFSDKKLTCSAQAAGTLAFSKYDESLFTNLEWRGIGPNRGGRSIAVAGSPSRPFEYYFGATGGGLWKTTDGGTTWKPVSDKFFKSSPVGAVAVSEANPDVVYVGMGETELRGDVIEGDGIYKSTDGGETWTHMGLAETQSIAKVRIHPTNPDLVYVAAFGHLYGPNEERGVYRSTDGGKNWEKVLFRSSRAGAIDLCLDPKNPQVAYASTWEGYRTSYTLWSGGPGSGLFKSTDGGTTWTELTQSPGLPKGLLGKISVAVAGQDSNRVYALVEAEEGGLFVSDDAGATWIRVNSEPRIRHRAFYYGRVYADPTERDTIYIPNTGFYRSTDGGKSFKTIRVLHGDSHDMWISPNDSRRMISSNDGGASVSINWGETWTELDYPTAQFYNAFTTKHIPYHVCGAQQDNSTACVPSDGRGDFLYPVGGGESGYIAPDPKNPDVFFAGSYGGVLTRNDRSTGQRLAVDAWPENPMGHAAEEITERFQWTYPIVFSPTQPSVLFVGSQHLWRSTNQGMNWEKLSPDLTRHDPSTMGPAGGPLSPDMTGVEVYATIFSIAPSHHDIDAIWIGSDDGLVHLTRDGGKTWMNVTPGDLPEFSRVSLIEASPHKAGTAYLAANRYQQDDRAPYVFKTDDYGETWTKIIESLPGNDFARVIREDIKRPGLLYLGTEHGVYVSFNDGTSWQSLRLNLPVTSVQGLVVEQNDLVIGTHGRGFYVLDDIGVLRQLTPEVAAANVHLFDPHDVIKSVDQAVAIDYHLNQAVDEVSIDFLDEQGQLVRTFIGRAGEREQPVAREEDETARYRPSAPPVPTSAGMNRFTWNLRYPDATYTPGLVFFRGSTRGPVAAPGVYEVRLTVRGETKTQRFEIRKDPRLINVSDADLQEQFTLTKQINDCLSRAVETVIRIRRLKAQARNRIERGTNAPFISSAEALAERLTEIEGEIVQYRYTRRGDGLRYPLRLVEKLASLQNAVESGDTRPTAQSYAVFKKFSDSLDEQLSSLDGVLRSDLPPLNRLLTAQGLELIREESR